MALRLGEARSPLTSAVLHRNSRAGRKDILKQTVEESPKDAVDLGDQYDSSGSPENKIRSYRLNPEGELQRVPLSQLDKASLPAIPSQKFEVSASEVTSALYGAELKRRNSLKTNQVLSHAVLPKDASVNPDFMTFYADQAYSPSLSFARQAAFIGKFEGFHVRVATSEAHLAGVAGGDNVSTVLIPQGGRWLEDYSDALQDGGRLLPALFDDKNAESVIHQRRERSLKGLEADFEMGVLVNQGKLQRTGAALAINSQGALVEAATHIEGGNILPGVLEDGKLYGLVGADSVAVTKMILESDTGRQWDESAVQEIIAKERGIEPQNLHTIEQPGAFHLDMAMLALGPGEVLLNDSVAAAEQQIDWLFSDLDEISQSSGATPEEVEAARAELQEVARRIRKEASTKSKYEALSEKDLKKAGLSVHRIPGVYYTVKKPGDITPQEKHAAADYFNGRSGTNERGEQFAMLLGGLPREEAAFAEQLLKLDGTKLKTVHFFDPMLTDEVLSTFGGVKCLSQFDGKVEL